MPLRIDLKPLERLIINGALIQNGNRRASIIIETQCKFLRESEIIHESEADTPAKQLCMTLQLIYLSDEPAEAISLFYAQAAALLRAAPSMGPLLLAIQEALDARRYHPAIKRARDLIAYEDALLRPALAGAAREPVRQAS